MSSRNVTTATDSNNQQQTTTTYQMYKTDDALLNHVDEYEDHEDHHHHHEGAGCIKSKSTSLIAMLVMVASFFVAEALVGQITNSLTLLADSFHMLSDALALVVALVAVTYSKRRSNQYLKPWFSRNRYSNTFGWVRFEVVGALVNATFLLALCLSIAMEAIEKLMKPELPTDPHLVLIVGACGLAVNLLGLCLFGGHVHHGHDHGHDHKHGHEHNHSNSYESPKKTKVTEHHNSHQHNHNHDQMNMRAVFLHVLGDALGSVVVIVTALMYIFIPHKTNNVDITTTIEPTAASTTSQHINTTTVSSLNTTTCPCESDHEQVDFNKWILYVDPAMSLILVVILCVTTIPLFKQSGFILMQSVPVHIDIEDLKNKFGKVPGIAYIHDFHVWQLAGNKVIATIHIRVKDLDTYQRVATELKSKLCGVGIHSLTIQPEFGNLSSKSCYMECDSLCDKNGTCCPPPTDTENEQDVANNQSTTGAVRSSGASNIEGLQMIVRQGGRANPADGTRHHSNNHVV